MAKKALVLAAIAESYGNAAAAKSQSSERPLLDHAGLARSLASSFRQWWRQWLNQQGGL